MFLLYHFRDTFDYLHPHIRPFSLDFSFLFYFDLHPIRWDGVQWGWYFLFSNTELASFEVYPEFLLIRTSGAWHPSCIHSFSILFLWSLFLASANTRNGRNDPQNAIFHRVVHSPWVLFWSLSIFICFCAICSTSLPLISFLFGPSFAPISTFAIFPSRCKRFFDLFLFCSVLPVVISSMEPTLIAKSLD